MANRLTDSTKWNKPFIRGMKAPYKLLWLYLLDECDHAGIWQVDFDVAQLKIGEKLKPEIALQSFGSKVSVIDGGEKWFIKDFIEFQYKTLNPANRVHESVIKILAKYNLLDDQNNIIKPLTSPLQGAMDMDKDKDKDKAKAKDSELTPEMVLGNQVPSLEEFMRYTSDNYDGNFEEIRSATKLKYKSWVENGWRTGKGAKILNWKSTLLNTLPHLKESKIKVSGDLKKENYESEFNTR